MEEVAQFPLIDNHSHFLSRRSSPHSGVAADDLLKAMDAAGIRRMVLAGMGPEVPQLAKEHPHRFVAAYVLYNFRTRQDPTLSQRLPERARIQDGTSQREVDWIGGEFEDALRTGEYHALAEISTVGEAYPKIGMLGVDVKPDSPLVMRLIELAGRYDVPINIHCEARATSHMVSAVGAHPKTRVIWAHTGSYLSTAQIAELLRQYANLDFDLSARNPLYARGRGGGLLSVFGGLDAAWRDLFEAFPERFYFGVDFLFAKHLRAAAAIGEYARAIFTQLSPATARKLAYENAVRSYRLRPA